MVYEVMPIMAGKFGPVSNNVICRNGDPSTAGMVPSYVFYIKSSSLNIIVDMSFSSPLKCSRLTGLRCERVGSLDRILKKHGVDAAAIDMVICTHLHWDHAGNGNLFSNAKIVCQRDELAWAIAPPSWEPGYSKDFSGEFIEVLDRVETVDGNVVLQEGLELVKLGGHTPGTQAVVVNTVQGQVIIPGDLVMSYQNLKELVPIGLFHNLSECVDGIQWLRSQDALVLPGHDWKTLHFGRE